MFKKLVIFSLLTSLAIGLQAQAKRFTPHDIFRMERVIGVAMSPDGNYVAYTLHHDRPVTEGKGSDSQDLYILDLRTGESRPYILNTGNVLTDMAWSPDGSIVTFLANLGSGKGRQVWGIRLDGGAYYRLTDAPASLKHYGWGPEGKRLAYTHTTTRYAKGSRKMVKMGFDAEVFEEQLTDVTLFAYNLESEEVVRLNEEGSVFGFQWSPTGTHIAAMIAPNNLVDDSYMFKRIHTIELGTGKVEKLVDNPGKLTQISWSPDGKYLAFVSASDRSDPVSGSLFISEVANPKPFAEMRDYTEGFEGQANHVEWRDNKTLLYSCYESVDATLREIEVGKKKSKVLLEGGNIVYSSFSLGGGRIALSADSREHPPELYTLDLTTSELTRRTDSNPWLKDIEMGKQEKISYKAKDGLRVDGILVYPVDYEEGKRYPLITYIHGGPESCEHDGWVTYYSKWGQMAAGEGYAVFLPNYRASSGRGVAYQKADQKDLVAAEFEDVIDGIDYLIDQGIVDKDKVGIGGGSYGGYFSAWAATKHSERFAASVVFVGVTNQISKRNLTDIPYEDYYVHWTIWTHEDPELMYDRSPVKFAQNSTTPTLILHGKNDTRVHPTQSLELYRELKQHGKAPVRLVWYPGEGHGNANSPAQLDYSLRTLRWFDYYLKSDQPKDQKPPQQLDYGIEEMK